MADFLNPNFNPTPQSVPAGQNNAQGSQPSPDAAGPVGPANANPANTQISANDMLNLLATYSQPAQQNIQNMSVVESVQAFANSVSPSDHAAMLDQVKSTIAQEYNLPANSNTLNVLAQDTLDNYLIGSVGINKVNPIS